MKSCRRYKRLIRKYFDFLFSDYQYEIVYYERIGRFKSGCLFGVDAREKIRFQFRGELGPDIWVGLPGAPFVDETKIDGEQYWWGVGPVLDFILDRQEGTWLKMLDEDVSVVVSDAYLEESLKQYAEDIKFVLPELFKMFCNREAVASWASSFETFTQQIIDERYPKT
jgi:hypothetical protein